MIEPLAVVEVALRVFANGEPDKPTVVVRRATDLATAGAGGSHAPARAARASEAVTPEATAGRAPPGSVGAARRYNYEASPKHGTEKVGNVSAAPKAGQAALDSSVQVKETSPTSNETHSRLAV